MDNSVYIALSRQLALFRDMDVTANNLANTNTTGFSAEHMIFKSYVMKDVNQGDRNPMAFADDAASYRNMETGALKTTNNPLDAAIQGNGYFAVQTPMGTRYTRAGSFQIDGSGTLTTTDGYPVLDASNQPIALPENTTSIQIGAAGNLKVNGEDFGAIAIVQFAHPQLLERLNGKLFKSDVLPQPATDNFSVAQGMLEDSNVQPVVELTHMMTLSHTVADTAQFVAIVYDLERKAATAWTQQS